MPTTPVHTSSILNSNKHLVCRDNLRAFCERFIELLEKSKSPHKESLINVFKNHTFIAGGAVRSLMLEKPINDYDVYFTTISKAAWFIDNIEKALDGTLKTFGFCLRRSRTAATMQIPINYNKYSNGYIKIQFIIKQYGKPEDVISKFDFTNCMGYYRYRDNILFMSGDMKRSLETMTLIFNPECNSYPKAMIVRKRKFVEMGFNFPLTEELRMVYKIMSTPAELFAETYY